MNSLWRVRLRGLGTVCGVLALSACVTDVTPPQQLLWEADLDGAPPEHLEVTGTAAAVSDGRVTQASIAVTDLPAGTFAWRILLGQCGSPGELVGVEFQYPNLVGPGEAATNADPALGAGMVSGSSYFVEVRTAETADLVACGDFRRR